jgi:arsenical pump membrane protein
VREINPLFLVFVAAMGAHPATGGVLAVLIGVNVVPNLTDTGSLATLLWRGCCMTGVTGRRWPGSPGSVCLTVPACVLLATIAPWLVLAVA